MTSIFYKMKSFQNYKKWFLFPLKRSFRFHSLFAVSRFKGLDQKRNFSEHVLQFKERLVSTSRPLFVFYDLVRKWGLDAKEKIKLSFSWSLLKYLNFKGLLHVLAVLCYLRNVRRVMGLVFSADFWHTFSKKIFFIKWSDQVYYLGSVA